MVHLPDTNDANMKEPVAILMVKGHKVTSKTTGACKKGKPYPQKATAQMKWAWRVMKKTMHNWGSTDATLGREL